MFFRKLIEFNMGKRYYTHLQLIEFGNLIKQNLFISFVRFISIFQQLGINIPFNFNKAFEMKKILRQIYQIYT